MLIVLGAAALATALWIAIQSGDSAESSGLIPALLLCGWCVLLLSFVNLFHAVPPSAGPGLDWRARLAISLQRALLWGVGFGFLLLSLALVLVSYKLLSAWFAA